MGEGSWKEIVSFVIHTELMGEGNWKEIVSLVKLAHKLT